MNTNFFTVAARAKGPFALFRRAYKIARHYGLTADSMDQALHQFSDVLGGFDFGATFPITAVILQRHAKTISKFLDHNIEFAVHGYTHVDYAQLAQETQLAHLKHAREVFTNAGITPRGFRSPYLSRDDHLYAAIEEAGFSYVSNQPFLWDVLDQAALGGSMSAIYERALAFYDPWRASERPSLPWHRDHLVEIPVALPDDEILIERLGGENGLVKNTWLRILSQSYRRGELFTLQLHPERIGLCAEGLSAVLVEARALTPAVWCARLDEIASWWKARTGTSIEISAFDDGEYHCIVSGPSGTTVLAREVEVDAPCSSWMNGYQEVKATRFTFKAPLRPFIGLSPVTSPVLASFLRQQGFIVEISQDRRCYSYYIDQANFDASHELSVLAQIEESGCPLLRLGRWPNGAQSALAITGDIDALTVWDYVLRLIGK